MKNIRDLVKGEIVYEDELNKADKDKYVIYIGLNVKGAGHLAIDGGEDPDDFHVTLLYGYYHPQSDVEDTATRIQSAREKAIAYIPDTLKLDAIGRFEASDSSDGKDVIYARVAPGQLEKAHNILLKELNERGLKVQTTFEEYNPHMTLAYIDPDEEVELKEIDETVTIKNLTEGFETDEYSSKENESTFNIAKTDDDKRLVFGWALVAKDKDGNVIKDHQNDMIDEDDLEEGAYEYVLNFRDAGEEHIPGLRKKARMVESCVFTEEKQKALGIPEGIVPTGWWIGFYVDDDEAWNKIKNGTYKMFSIEGKAIRVPVDEVQHTDDLTKSDNVAKTFSEILKFNPYHDKLGRFASANGANSFSASRWQMTGYDDKKTAFEQRGAAGGASDDGSGSFAPKKSDDVTDKLSGKTLSLSSNTITIKDENGKTKGMLRNITQITPSNSNDQMLMHNFKKKSDVDIREFGTGNIYKYDGNIYIFNNTKTDYVYPKLKNVNKEEYDRFVERKKNLRKAEEAGAYIVNYIKY